MIETAQLLKGKGLKVTPQRISIYNMLINTNSHPKAEVIYKALEPTNPTMSLATVYKTLDSFKSSGLIQELNIGDGCSHYDARITPHPHIICTKCGEIYDILVDISDNIKQQLEPFTDFIIESEQIFLYGKCSKCQEK